MVIGIAAIVFVLGYLLISLEHKLHTNKSAVALLMGGVLWLLVAMAGIDHFGEEIMHVGSEIFDIVAFLLAAMSLIEILVHYQFFDVIRGKIFALGFDERKQFLVISGITFFLSAIIDNLTTTIVMIQIARKFFKEGNLVIIAAAIVIAANAGGAFSPVGDVTTIMLWLADKFTVGQILTRGFIPSLAIYITAMAMMYWRIGASKFDSKKEIIVSLTKSERLVVTLVFSSFSLPLLMGFIGLPPYIGLLIGLGLVWLTIDLLKKFSPRETHLEAEIDKLIQKTDIASLKFFIGILLAVSALNTLGVLSHIGGFMYGDSPSISRIMIGNIGLGMVSSVLDNVPLTAIAIEILQTTNASLWVQLALAVGTGGSLMVIGSAAGVIAMGMVKELTVTKYIQIAFWPAFVSYFVGMAVWYLQYLILGPAV